MIYFICFIVILFCMFVYFGIRIQYIQDVPLIMSNFWNPLGPVEYTIKECTEFNYKLQKTEKYYKIYWNLYPFLKKIGINLAETADKIVYIDNDCEYIPNYFKTVNSAIMFLNKDRMQFNYTINTENN